MKVLDLCAGTGSATKAFVDRGHDVDTLDIIGGHTFNMDVRKFKPWKKYDFIWASPPCTEFSIVKGIACKDRNPDLSIVRVCQRICKDAPYSIMENPRGCLRYFIGSEGFPFFYSTSKHHPNIQNMKYSIKKLDTISRKDARAMIPYGLSSAICKALEREIE